MPRRRRTWGWWTLIVSGLGAVAVLGLVHMTLPFFACGMDTSYCAPGEGTEFREQGRYFTYDGRPIQTELTVTVDRSGSSRVRRLQTDEQGRYCFTTPTSDTMIVPHQTTSTAPVDPRFQGAEGADRLRLTRNPRDNRRIDRRGGGFVVRPVPHDAEIAVGAMHWDPGIDAPATCAPLGASLPWYRYEDLGEAWQYGLMIALLAGTAALLLAAAFSGPRNERGRLLGRLSAGALAIDVVVFLVLWGFFPTPTGEPNVPIGRGTATVVDNRPPTKMTRANLENSFVETAQSQEYSPVRLIAASCSSVRTCTATFAAPIWDDNHGSVIGLQPNSEVTYRLTIAQQPNDPEGCWYTVQRRLVGPAPADPTAMGAVHWTGGSPSSCVQWAMGGRPDAPSGPLSRRP